MAASKLLSLNFEIEITYLYFGRHGLHLIVESLKLISMIIVDITPEVVSAGGE